MFGKTHMPHTPPRTVADVEGFVSLLLAACNDSKIKVQTRRKTVVPSNLALENDAPQAERLHAHLNATR